MHFKSPVLTQSAFKSSVKYFSWQVTHSSDSTMILIFSETFNFFQFLSFFFTVFSLKNHHPNNGKTINLYSQREFLLIFSLQTYKFRVITSPDERFSETLATNSSTSPILLPSNSFFLLKIGLFWFISTRGRVFDRIKNFLKMKLKGTQVWSIFDSFLTLR